MNRQGLVRNKQVMVTDTSTGAASTNQKVSVGVGLGGALISSTCCLLPALALAAGFGGAAGLVQLGRYQPYLLAAGLLFVGGWNWHTVQRRASCCTTPEQRRALYLWPIVSIAIFLLAYVIINYALVPWFYGIRASDMPFM